MTRGEKVSYEPRLLPSSKLASLFEALKRQRYNIVGPTVRNGAILLDPIHSPKQLPVGWTDEQSAGPTT